MSVPSEPIPESSDASGGAAEAGNPPATAAAIVAGSDSGPPAQADELAPVRVAGRALKLVVTLQPDDGGYRAVLALGAEGCDPLFRSVVAADLSTALDEAPALVADAEQRWRTQPRYAAAATTQPPARRNRPAETRSPSSEPAAEPAPESPHIAQGSALAPTPKAATSPQMALFG